MDQQDLFVLLCMALRYAICRNDGSVLTYERLVQRYGRLLSKSQRQQIISEIGEKSRAWFYACPVAEIDTQAAIEVQRGWESIAGYLARLSDEMFPSEEEIAAMRKNNIIDAIKLLRGRLDGEGSGARGLHAAKEIVEKWRADPSKYFLWGAAQVKVRPKNNR